MIIKNYKDIKLLIINYQYIFGQIKSNQKNAFCMPSLLVECSSLPNAFYIKCPFLFRAHIKFNHQKLHIVVLNA